LISDLTPKTWYWIRRSDGSLAPYLFHRLCADERSGREQAEFFVGSFIQVFELSQIVGPAEMPSPSQATRTE
jgi:hypothetical protein